jgi:hypothetical protein
MTVLLRLYPRRWRRRYGAEVEHLLEGRRFSLALAIDLIAGAIDVRLHPGVTMAAAAASAPQEENNMTSRILALDCSGGRFSQADQRRAVGVTILGTVVLTLAWMWAHARLGDNPYVDSLSVLPFLVPYLASMRMTYLKERPFNVYLAFVIGWTLILTVFLLAVGSIAAKI